LEDGMSFTISTAQVQQFAANLRFLAQQKGSRVRGTHIEDTLEGERRYLEQLAPTAAQKRRARNADSPIMNSQHLRRSIASYDYEWGDLVDREDKARLLIDPESDYAINAGMALMRSWDDEFIAAAFGTAYTGHAGATAVTWPNGDNESTPTAPAGTVVAVNDWTFGNGAGNAGLTISKLISAKTALDAAEVDEDEERTILVGAKQMANLLATTEATSSDYNTVKALVDGTISNYMGFKFRRSQRLLLDGSGYTRVIAYAKSGVGMGITADIWAKTALRADKGFANYVYAAMSIGASRLEEARVVEIKCL
jgi:hypothetical protein